MNTEEKKKVEEGYTIKGADEATLNYVKENSSFTDVLSDDAKNRQAKSDNALKGYESIATGDKIVSDKTWGKINSTFNTPTAVTEADNYLKSALSKIQSGKTSYSDQVRDMMSQIQNRDKFSYDVDSDPLFQQALASAMNSGKSAMQDAIGQASALTGGYGSSYATSAANQAYNSFIEDAYNNLPQYYQMALEAYQMEGDEMYRQLDMLNTADATEYGRLLNAYDATYSHRNQMYNEAYQQHRDSISDAFASANLQISEHGQLANDAFNLYSAYANEANTAYNREYQQWSDSIDNAWKMIGAQNSDYWANENFKEGQRQHDESIGENQRQFNITHGDTDGDGKLSPAEVEAYDKYLKEQDQKEWDYKYATLGEDQRQFNITHGDTDGDGKLSGLEIQTYNAPSGGNVKPSSLSTPEINELKEIYLAAYDEDNPDAASAAVFAHLSAKGKTLSPEQASSLEEIFTSALTEANMPIYDLDWEMYDKYGALLEGADDTLNGGGGDDNNDVYVATVNGETKAMTYEDIVASINASDLSDEEKQNRINALKDKDKK